MKEAGASTGQVAASLPPSVELHATAQVPALSIRLLVDPPLDRRHKLRAGQVHQVLRAERAHSLSRGSGTEGRLLGWWIRCRDAEVLILCREAEVLR